MVSAAYRERQGISSSKIEQSSRRNAAYSTYRSLTGFEAPSYNPPPCNGLP